jgi:hypothetical protein
LCAKSRFDFFGQLLLKEFKNSCILWNALKGLYVVLIGQGRRMLRKRIREESVSRAPYDMDGFVLEL